MSPADLLDVDDILGGLGCCVELTGKMELWPGRWARVECRDTKLSVATTRLTDSWPPASDVEVGCPSTTRQTRSGEVLLSPSPHSEALLRRPITRRDVCSGS